MKNFAIKLYPFVIIAVLMLNFPLYAQLEWGMRIVESVMQRNQVRSWAYPDGFYSFAQYRMWKATGNQEYFDYIKNNADQYIDANGNINTSLTSLDNSQMTLIALMCYVETGEEKFKLAAEKVRNVYRTYPRTSDNGFWHTMSNNGQLWLDGVYMICPFLANYAKVFNDTTLYSEVTHQIITYASHLADTSGLLFHAYDEDGSSSWAIPPENHSSQFWGRSMGWFGMAIIEILEVLPEDHPKRQALIDILANLIEGLSKYQEPDTGLWYQVVNLPDDPRNWSESSCSSMYSFFTSRAVQKGYVDSTYLEMARKAYEGVIAEKVNIGTDGLVNLIDICQGTGVSSDVNYYFDRARNTNDLHGLGALLMMCWQQGTSAGGSGNQLPYVTISSPTDSSYHMPNGNVEIKVTSFDVDGDVVQVEFYEGDNLLFTDTELPWEFTWENVPAGDYFLTAIATDDSGAAAASNPVHIYLDDNLLTVEAETGTMSDGTVDSNHAGFTGTGFVNLVNSAGTYLLLPFEIPKPGKWDLSIRYGNGSTDNRICEIQLDEEILIDQFDFQPTGDWPDWQYSDIISIELTAGAHTLRITGLTSGSAPNLDHVRLEFQNNGSDIDFNSPIMATRFELQQNYPNPFNASTTIRYMIAKAEQVQLKLFNIQGREVRRLVDEQQTVGEYSVQVNCQNLATGIYFYELKSGTFEQRRKFLLIK